jgi:DNA repair ATPase RecN
VPGTGTQAVPIAVEPQAAASPTQGQAINIQLADAINRREAAPILLVGLLKATHDNASEWLEQLPVWFQNLRSTKDSLPQEDEALQRYQDELNKKQAGINTLDAKFEDIVQAMPKEQLEELQLVREKTRLTMLGDKEELVRRLDNCLRGMEDKKTRIERLEGSVRSLKSGIPEAIETLKTLVTQLPDL